MARRRKATRPRRSRSISVLNAFESYMYANILTQGALGTSPIGVITGDTDLSMVTGSVLGQTYDLGVAGAGQISLGDIVSQPGLALATVQSNVMSNWQSMALQTFATRISFKFGKRLLRAPLANINRNLMKPLGVGIRL